LCLYVLHFHSRHLKHALTLLDSPLFTSFVSQPTSSPSKSPSQSPSKEPSVSPTSSPTAEVSCFCCLLLFCVCIRCVLLCCAASSLSLDFRIAHFHSRHLKHALTLLDSPLFTSFVSQPTSSPSKSPSQSPSKEPSVSPTSSPTAEVSCFCCLLLFCVCIRCVLLCCAASSLSLDLMIAHFYSRHLKHALTLLDSPLFTSFVSQPTSSPSKSPSASPSKSPSATPTSSPTAEVSCFCCSSSLSLDFLRIAKHHTFSSHMISLIFSTAVI